MVSVAVLIKIRKIQSCLFPFVGAAARATAPNGYFVAGRLETIRHRDGRSGGIRRQIDIVGATAFIAIKVVMFPHIGAITPGHPVQVDLPNQPALHEGIEAIVNRGHRDVGQSFLGAHEHLFGGRMIAFLEQDVVNVLALRRGPKASRGKPFGQPFVQLFAQRFQSKTR